MSSFRTWSKSWTKLSALVGQVCRICLYFKDLNLTLSTAAVKSQAVRVVLSITCGAFHTSLLTYFTQRDLFPSLMSSILDSQSESATLSFILCGILANCNKFEIYNPYQSRIANLSHDVAIDKIVEALATACSRFRDSYVAVQDDSPQPWSIGGTLSYVGLGSLAGRKPSVPALTEDEARTRFMEL